MVSYTPILRWKAGERSALRNLSSQGRVNVTPVIVVNQSQYKDAAHLVGQIGATWGATKVLLDVSDLPATQNKHSLDDIGPAATADGLHIVPAIRAGAPKQYLAAVQRRVATDNQGAALRIGLSLMTKLSNLGGQWPIKAQETDLIVDLGSSVANIVALGAPALQAFANLHDGTNWRSVTVAGGSIPENLTGYAVGPTLLPRSEIELWRDLMSYGLKYDIQFGDYVTIGPDAVTDNIPGPVPINAKYTLIDEFLILHGVKPTGPKGVERGKQYRGHAKAILKQAGYAPLAHCWGDDAVAKIANIPSGSPGSPTSWVSYSINRHIELTRSQLP